MVKQAIIDRPSVHTDYWPCIGYYSIVGNVKRFPAVVFYLNFFNWFWHYFPYEIQTSRRDTRSEMA
jgi:hypothetical protein